MGGYRRYDPNAKPEPFRHTRGERIVHAIEYGAGLLIALAIVVFITLLIMWGVAEVAQRLWGAL
jgi:hypothetical protein